MPYTGTQLAALRAWFLAAPDHAQFSFDEIAALFELTPDQMRGCGCSDHERRSKHALLRTDYRLIWGALYYNPALRRASDAQELRGDGDDAK